MLRVLGTHLRCRSPQTSCAHWVNRRPLRSETFSSWNSNSSSSSSSSSPPRAAPSSSSKPPFELSPPFSFSRSNKRPSKFPFNRRTSNEPPLKFPFIPRTSNEPPPKFLFNPRTSNNNNDDNDNKNDPPLKFPFNTSRQPRSNEPPPSQFPFSSSSPNKSTPKLLFNASERPSSELHFPFASFDRSRQRAITYLRAEDAKEIEDRFLKWLTPPGEDPWTHNAHLLPKWTGMVGDEKVSFEEMTSPEQAITTFLNLMTYSNELGNNTSWNAATQEEVRTRKTYHWADETVFGDPPRALVVLEYFVPPPPPDPESTDPAAQVECAYSLLPDEYDDAGINGRLEPMDPVPGGEAATSRLGDLMDVLKEYKTKPSAAAAAADAESGSSCGQALNEMLEEIGGSFSNLVKKKGYLKPVLYEMIGRVVELNILAEQSQEYSRIYSDTLTFLVPVLQSLEKALPQMEQTAQDNSTLTEETIVDHILDLNNRLGILITEPRTRAIHDAYKELETPKPNPIGDFIIRYALVDWSRSTLKFAEKRMRPLGDDGGWGSDITDTVKHVAEYALPTRWLYELKKFRWPAPSLEMLEVLPGRKLSMYKQAQRLFTGAIQMMDPLSKWEAEEEEEDHHEDERTRRQRDEDAWYEALEAVSAEELCNSTTGLDRTGKIVIHNYANNLEALRQQGFGGRRADTSPIPYNRTPFPHPQSWFLLGRPYSKGDIINFYPQVSPFIDPDADMQQHPDKNDCAMMEAKVEAAAMEGISVETLHKEEKLEERDMAESGYSNTILDDEDEDEEGGGFSSEGRPVEEALAQALIHWKYKQDNDSDHDIGVSDYGDGDDDDDDEMMARTRANGGNKWQP